MRYIDAEKLKKTVEQAKQRALKGAEVDKDLYCDGRAVLDELTWKDMKQIDMCFHEVAEEQTTGKLKLHSFREMYEEVLHRFLESKKKIKL